MRDLYSAACIIIVGFPLIFTPGGAAANILDSDASSVVIMIHRNPRTLKVWGHSSSTAHEIILRQLAQRYFGHLTIDVDLDTASQAPPGWPLVTELVLRALAHTDAARATITTGTVTIEGVTTRPNEYAAALLRIKTVLLEGMSIASDVSELATGLSFAQLCQARFRTVAASGRIEFAVSSTDIEGNAAPLLDALIEIAIDCPATTIVVTGYTDNRGDVTANQMLGRARARRVIEYMAGHGVPIEQFGAAVPSALPAPADNGSVLSRKLNRRADLEMVLR